MGMITNNVKCKTCPQSMALPMTQEQWAEFQLPGPQRRNVQDIFPHLTPDQREILISGLCPTCWDELFEDEL